MQPPDKERRRPQAEGGAHHETLTDTIRQAADAARALARLGVPIFTCDLTADGDPIPPRGWERTKADHRTVTRWRPGLGLCAVMGTAFDVLDCDPRNGGLESVRQLPQRVLPRYYGRLATPSGGWHWWIAPLGIGKHTGFRPGLDLIGGRPDGSGRGFAFLPPTRRPSKTNGRLQPYRWLGNPPAGAPDPGDTSGGALAALITAPRTSSPGTPPPQCQVPPPGAYGAAALTREAAIVAATARGRRNDQLNLSAFRLYQLVARGDLKDADVTAALLAAADANGLTADDGLRRVMATISSARNAGLANPRQAA